MILKNYISISNALNEVAEIYKSVAEKKEIQLESKIVPGIEYFGDENRIKQLAVILIDNAIKYSDSWGKVSFELTELDTKIEIKVTDKGIGIEKEYIDNIFKRFFRVDKARSREGGGSGLGLSIADWIVKEHRGNINVYSVKDNGTVFRIIMPRLQ